MIHELPIRVYYEDTDAGGIVYYANYLKFAERGRTEFLRALELDNPGLLQSEGMFFVVARVEIDYKRPLRLDDMLVIKTEIASVTDRRIVMKQAAVKDDKIHAEMMVTLACVTREGRAVMVPEILRERMKAFEAPAA